MGIVKNQRKVQNIVEFISDQFILVMKNDCINNVAEVQVELAKTKKDYDEIKITMARGDKLYFKGHKSQILFTINDKKPNNFEVGTDIFDVIVSMKLAYMGYLISICKPIFE